MDEFREIVDGVPSKLKEPRSYYEGVGQSNRILCDNVIVFERLSRRALQQQQLANRMHHRYVLVRVLETGGVASVDGQSFRLDVGDALLLMPYQFHHFHDLDSERLRWLIITFDLVQGQSLLAALSYHRLQFDPEAHAQWAEVVRLWTSDTPESQAELLPALDRMLVRLRMRTSIGKLGADEARLNPGSRWVSEIESLIIQSVREGWTFGEVAERAGLSERHLRKRFEQQMGLTMSEYRSNFQFHTAISLMRDSSCSLSSVAELCGFNSQSVFTRFIRRRSGLTPRELSQEVRAGNYTS
ncbi:MAG: AraC family transcriptional regulator [Verrucomicrobiales bacterium]